MNAADDDRWYYQVRPGEPSRGPVSTFELLQMAGGGDLLPGSHVRRNLDGDWSKASSLPWMTFPRPIEPQRMSLAPSPLLYAEPPLAPPDNRSITVIDARDKRELSPRTVFAVAGGAVACLALVVGLVMVNRPPTPVAPTKKATANYQGITRGATVWMLQGPPNYILGVSSSGAPMPPSSDHSYRVVRISDDAMTLQVVGSSLQLTIPLRQISAVIDADPALPPE